MRLILAAAIAAWWATSIAYGADPAAQAIGADIGRDLLERYPVQAVIGRTPKANRVTAALTNVRTIAVIRPFEPRTYTVTNFGDPSAQFIGAGDQATAPNELTTVVKQHSTAPISALLADDIAAQLTRLGYAAKITDGPWEVTDGYFTIDFDKLQSSADALLVIKPTVAGFVATGPDSPYLPTITAIVTILRTERKEVLYRGFHASGWAPMGAGWRHSAAAAEFKSPADIALRAQAAAGTLAEAAAKIAVAVAEDLDATSRPR